MEKYGICPMSYAFMKSSREKSAPISNQIIWGDMFEILDQKNNSSLIRLAHDDNKGWVDSRQILPVDKKFYSSRTFEIVGYVSNTRAKLLLSKSGYIDLPFGAQLSIQEWESRTIYWKGLEGKLVGCGDYETLPKIEDTVGKIKNYVDYLPKAPQIEGGRTQWGWDAAGFTQSIFRVCGIPYIKRNLNQQSKQGREIANKKTQAGQLIFFTTQEEIDHVGLLISEDKVWHCFGNLKVSTLIDGYLVDDFGIKTHRMHSLRSILN